MIWAFVRYLHVKMVVLLFLISVSGLAAAIATGFIVCLAGLSLLLLVPNPSQLLRAPVIVISVGIATAASLGWCSGVSETQQSTLLRLLMLDP
ncbi:hypothetical protein ACFQL7_06880 [Halocatena marina]|uniref:Uncharacterized protein n=1 Tax=Halocatena marina TaxID=2934937 RepID=A0ABD5YK49_9EURY